MKARRLRIVGTDVDWILRIDKGSNADTLIAVVPTGERVGEYPYNKPFEFERAGDERI